MEYYVIVDKIKKEHESGIYGRKTLSKEELKELNKKLLALGVETLGATVSGIFFPFGMVRGLTMFARGAYEFLSNKNNYKPITLQYPIQEENKILIIDSKLLLDNYEIDEEYLYGELYNLQNKPSEKLKKLLGINNILKKMLQVGQNSKFIILERDNLASKFIHPSGNKNAKFDYGIYISHPKNNKILLPLYNYSNKLEELIREEIINIYRKLGAKKIIIKEILDVDGNSSTKLKKQNSKLDLDLNISKKLMKEVTFGKSPLNLENIKEDMLLTHDFESVCTVVNSRIGNGNMISYTDTQEFDINLGISIDILELFEMTNNVSYRKKWYFNVEFYDKNDLKNI